MNTTLLPDGSASELSMFSALRARGTMRMPEDARRGDRVPGESHEPIGPNNSDLPRIDIEAAIHDPDQRHDTGPLHPVRDPAP